MIVLTGIWAVIFMWTGLVAVQNGGIATVNFNHFGEMYLEVFVVLPSVIVLSVVTAVLYDRRLKRDDMLISQKLGKIRGGICRCDYR